MHSAISFTMQDHFIHPDVMCAVILFEMLLHINMYNYFIVICNGQFWWMYCLTGSSRAHNVGGPNADYIKNHRKARMCICYMLNIQSKINVFLCPQAHHLKGSSCSGPFLDQINQENNLIQSRLLTYHEMLVPKTYP